MEISSLSQSSIKIKGKQAAIAIDPDNKTVADFVIELLSSGTKLSLVEGQRLLISGPGEFEVGGIKVSGTGKQGALVYTIRVDNVDVCLSTPEGLKAAGEKLKEAQIVIVNANTSVDSSSITSLAPSVVVLYGEHAVEGVKALGKEPNKVSKYVTTLEKLPTELEVVVLG